MGLFGKSSKKNVQGDLAAPMPAQMPSPMQMQGMVMSGSGMQGMPGSSQGPPTEDVVRFRQQGLSNAQIVEALQRSGYKTHQIFDALNQAELGRTGEPIHGAPFFDEPSQASQASQMRMPQAPQAQQEDQDSQEYAQDGSEEKIEEVVEAIIDEKWNELLKDINKIIEWKSAIEANMKSLEQRQQDLKQSFDQLQRALLSKIGDYDQNITNVGSELKALEKVFQKLLPAFTENVNELSRAVKDIKKK